MKFSTYGFGEPDDVILVSHANMNNVAPSSMTNFFDNYTFNREDQSTSRTPNLPKSDTFEHILSKHNSRVIRSYMVWVLIFNVMPMLVSFHDIHESNYIYVVGTTSWSNHVTPIFVITSFMVFSVMY